MADHVSAELLGSTRRTPGSSSAHRFYLLPRQPLWQHMLANLDIGATALDPAVDWWDGGLPVPKPPNGISSRSWLLPTTEPMAILVARWADQLRAAGWKVLAACESLVAELADKAALHGRAARLGLLSTLPQHHDSPADAKYPCLAKPTRGSTGQGVRVVHTPAEAAAAAELSARMGMGEVLLQEFIASPIEYSTSMLCRDGAIFDAVTCEYEYDRADYIWPMCHEVAVRCHDLAPPAHLRAIAPFLAGFTGICNANYKVTDGGRVRLFEINPRVGGDLGNDVPRTRAAALFQQLDALESGESTPLCLS